MARAYITGFETGHVASDAVGGSTSLTAGTTYDTGTVRTGTYSLRVSASSGAQTGGQFYSVVASRWARIWVRVTTRPSTTARIIIGGTGTNLNNILLNPNGTLTYRTDTATVGTSTTALTDTTRWYRLEWRTGGTGVVVLRIDGVDQVTGDGSPTMNCWLGTLDTVADTYTAYFDDLAIDDADWPGDGKVALLLPASQNSVTASTWQKPGGATTNMHTSVDNVPPVGVANSTNVAQAENQIRNAVSNATANVLFNMQTYEAAGLVSGDTVNAVQAFAIVGLATTATTKTGSLEVISNPAVAEVNFGAYGTGAAVGTFPTGWQRRSHTIAQNPSVTLNTAPVVELGQRTANTTIAQACFVGMYVDYTPAAAPPVSDVSIAYIGGGYYG